MSTTLARQNKSNISVRQAHCRTRNSTISWSLPEPARTQENNVEKIREEIKSNLASALNLFKQLPSVHKTTVHPGNQPNEAQSPRAVVPHGTTPRLIRSPIESPTLSVHNRDKVLLFSAKLLNRFQVV